MKFHQRICISLFFLSLIAYSIKRTAITFQTVQENLVVEPDLERKTKIDNGKETVDNLRWTFDIIDSHIDTLKNWTFNEQKGADDMLYERLVSDPEFQAGMHKARLLQFAQTLESDGNVDTKLPYHDNSPETVRKDLNVLLVANITLHMLQTLQNAVKNSFTVEIQVNETVKLDQVFGPGPWELWPYQHLHNNIRQHSFYTEEDANIVDGVLRNLQRLPLVKMYNIHEYGSQLKMLFSLEGGAKAVFKPIRSSIDSETDPNRYNIDDFDRHYAEIAAFHLDRLLGFRRVPPTVGRYLNLTSEMYPIAPKALRETYYISPSKNYCYYGMCDLYCTSGHSICGHPHVVEGSLSLWLSSSLSLRKVENPWAQSTPVKRLPTWMRDQKFCLKVKQKFPYNKGRRLLDIMDLSVFDFLMGNTDRHHYHFFKKFGKHSTLLHIGNGKGFGHPRHDIRNLLAGVFQCCLIRASTLSTLLNYHSGPNKLSNAMRDSLSKDILEPVLSDLHLQALDRRLGYVLKTVYKCITKNRNNNKIVVNDGF